MNSNDGNQKPYVGVPCLILVLAFEKNNKKPMEEEIIWKCFVFKTESQIAACYVDLSILNLYKC